MIVHIGDLRLAALVDTGADYDAIDKDLSEIQSARGNKAFVSRRACTPASVGGFANSMQHTTRSIATWNVTMTGSSTPNGNVRDVSYKWPFHEFKGLGDPLILGLPFLDDHGGLQTFDKHIWCCDTYVPRYFGRRMTPGSISSMSSLELPRPAPVTRSGYGPLHMPPVVLKDGGWHPLITYWDNITVLSRVWVIPSLTG